MIETEYNGQRIRYSENEDVWRCDACGFEGKTLSAVKTKVGKWIAQSRRVENVPILLFENLFSTKLQSGSAVLLDDDGEHVWVVTSQMRGGRETKEGRKKVKIKDILLDTPEIRQQLKEWQSLSAAADAARIAAKDYVGAIPRATIEALKVQPE